MNNISVNGHNVVMTNNGGSNVVINGEAVSVGPNGEFHGVVGGSEVHISNNSVQVGSRNVKRAKGFVTTTEETFSEETTTATVTSKTVNGVPVAAPAVELKVTDDLKERVLRAMKGWVK